MIKRYAIVVHEIEMESPTEKKESVGLSSSKKLLEISIDAKKWARLKKFLEKLKARDDSFKGDFEKELNKIGDEDVDAK